MGFVEHVAWQLPGQDEASIGRRLGIGARREGAVEVQAAPGWAHLSAKRLGGAAQRDEGYINARLPLGCRQLPKPGHGHLGQGRGYALKCALCVHQHP